MTIAILLFIGLSLTILIHEAGHFFAAKYFNLKVEEFGFGFPPRIFSKQRGETRYSVNWLPFGGFVKIYGENREEGIGEEVRRSFSFQPAYARAAVVVAGVVMNFVLGWFLLSLIFMIGTPTAIVVSEVREHSPAQLAGIREGDVIVGFKSAQEFILHVNTNQGQEISLEILEENETKNVSVIPRINPPEGEGALGIGLLDAGVPRKGFFESLVFGFSTAIATIMLVLARFYELVANVFGGGDGYRMITGPVGIFSVAQQVGRLGLIYVLQMIALISLNLAVFNILPFPALDGGRLFFIVIEKLKGSPLPVRFEQIANAVGFALLFTLMIAITVQDVGRLL